MEFNRILVSLENSSTLWELNSVTTKLVSTAVCNVMGCVMGCVIDIVTRHENRQ